MNGFKKIFAITAVVSILFGLLLAASLIVGIWLEFKHWAIWKSIGTFAILFLVSFFLHNVAKGMIEKPKDKP